MPDKFENGVFTLKTDQNFPSTLPRRNLKTRQPLVNLDLCLRKSRAGHHVIIVTSSVSKSLFFATRKRHPALTNFSVLKGVFRKPRFCDGLVWTVGLTVEIKLRFLSFSRVVWTGDDVTYNTITALLKDDTMFFHASLHYKRRGALSDDSRSTVYKIKTAGIVKLL